MKRIIFLFLVFCLLVTPCIATQTVNSTLNVTTITDNSITWSYTYLTDARPIGATLDGEIIEGFKTDYVYNYTAKNLEAGSTHEFCIFGEASSNCETGVTTKTPDAVSDFIITWLLLIIAIICVIITTFFNVPFMSYIGFIFALMGLLQNINNDFMAMTIYGIVMIITIFTGTK